jgi:hypothetical protein
MCRLTSHPILPTSYPNRSPFAHSGVTYSRLTFNVTVLVSFSALEALLPRAGRLVCS